MLQAQLESADLDRANGTLKITHPACGRARNVISRSRTRGTGMYPSWKMGRMVHWESPNELNAFRLLDADPTIRSFQEQPLAIRFELQGETHLHYPDLLIEWRDGRRALWEIKPTRKAMRPQTTARTRYLQAALPSVGFQYRMVLAEELRREPRLSNALTLLKYGRMPIGEVERECVRQLLAAVRVIRWASAVNGDLGPRGRPILCRLALEGVLSFDRDQPLTSGTAFTSGS